VAFKFELAVQHDSQILLGLDLFDMGVVDFDSNVSVVASWRCFVYHKAASPCSNKLNVAILQKWHISMVPLKLSNSSSTCDTNVAVASILCSISLVIEIKK
jgi:hypothetical protein